MQRKKVQTRTSRSSHTNKSCYFCDNKKEPDYKDVESIVRYVSDRGRIAGRKRSGLCAKHQRRLATAVKRARFLGLVHDKTLSA